MAEILYKELSFEIIGAAMEVHKTLGHGFDEKIYQAALEYELSLRKIAFVPQQHIQVTYKGQVIADYYLDLVVDGKIVIELKAVDSLARVHQSQILSYLKAGDMRLGLLINFGQDSLEHKRIIL